MMTYKEAFDYIYSSLQHSLFKSRSNENVLNENIQKENILSNNIQNEELSYECEARTFLLMDYFWNVDKSNYFWKKNDELKDYDKTEIDTILAKIDKGRPIQQITHSQYFYGYDFYVNENVLIPRLDTEILVEWIISNESNYIKKREDNNVRILDMCTGSGCIVISLIKNMPNFIADAADISEAALKVALTNAERMKVKLNLIKSDLFSNINEKYDIIVSNPPYIETHTIDTLDEEVKMHEPLLALDGGEDGLDFYRKISSDAKKYLNPGGCIYFEIGYNQGVAVQSILEENNFVDIEIKKDLAGLDRCVLGRITEEYHV